jgi:hypothetical protein
LGCVVLVVVVLVLVVVVLVLAAVVVVAEGGVGAAESPSEHAARASAITAESPAKRSATLRQAFCKGRLRTFAIG